ncbi:hypothetical protein [Streptomyces sp. UH6]|uniref:hypothetical protein n=1 Tax=Streptomyces sp. UH6 TaxID=2748379 RepID=UPI0015D4DEA7|nr:hypothetical protein [Streptomyces sp. UH6]NYV72940.1 hypothetical protein [Streptomyces sp. UH6]
MNNTTTGPVSCSEAPGRAHSVLTEDGGPLAPGHAEAVWRSLSEALDRAGEHGRVPFLVRLSILTALDHLSSEQFTTLITEAEAGLDTRRPPTVER